ncbi:MAG: hypothetical protein AAFO01_00985, partial [Pseudomonadota bacterium]
PPLGEEVRLAETRARVLNRENIVQAIDDAVTALDADERREEIARMLAGAEITDAARAAADSLLARSA